MSDQTTQCVFFALLRAGLWEREVRLLPHEPIDFYSVYELADAQSVVGLIAAGLEHVDDRKVEKKEALPFLKKVFSIEGRNVSMNAFICTLVEKMRSVGIYSLLVKGQGIAQCYERPLWRSSGDVDFFLSEDNYQRAIEYLIPLSSDNDKELSGEKHIRMTIDSWDVELHGSLPSRISASADKVLYKIQESVFRGGDVSVGRINSTDIFFLRPDESIIFVFTHFLKHFFRGGIGLRQICDWCRLIWTSRGLIDEELLMQRLKEMRFVSEWKAFAVFAVEHLGMPTTAMPYYELSSYYKKKANWILQYILAVGSFGKNRDSSFRKNKPFFVRKWMAFRYKVSDFLYHVRIFPMDSLRVLMQDFFSGIRSTIMGEG